MPLKRSSIVTMMGAVLRMGSRTAKKTWKVGKMKTKTQFTSDLVVMHVQIKRSRIA